jgi:DNA-directed RNA polymerase specialized sigma24 family protein
MAQMARVVSKQRRSESRLGPNAKADAKNAQFAASALDRLAGIDRRKAELVKLQFFAGMTITEAAAALGIAESTADADWAYAKSWLRVQMSEE